MRPYISLEAARAMQVLWRDFFSWLRSKLRPKQQAHPFENFNKALDFALDYTEEPDTFLRVWREGSWDVIDREWPEFRSYAAMDELTYIRLRQDKR